MVYYRKRKGTSGPIPRTGMTQKLVFLAKDPPWLHSNSILYTHVTRLMLWYVQPICFFSNPVGESVSGLSVPT